MLLLLSAVGHMKNSWVFFSTVCSSSFETEIFSKQPNVKHYFGFYGEGFLFFLLPPRTPLFIEFFWEYTFCHPTMCFSTHFTYIVLQKWMYWIIMYSMRISFSCFLTIKYMDGVWVENGGGNSVVHAMENKTVFHQVLFSYMFKCICARCDCRHMDTSICIYDPVLHNVTNLCKIFIIMIIILRNQLKFQDLL